MTTTFNSDPCCKLELIIKAERLKRKDLLTKSDPVCIVYQLCGRLTGNGETEWREVGRTERIRNTQEPEWTKHIALDYFFEERQTLKFDIWDWDTEALNTDLSEHDFLGSLGPIELAEIVSAGTYSRGLGDNGRDGTITVIPEEIDEGSREVLQLKMSAEKLDRKDFFGLGKSDPYLQFYRYEDNGSKTMVHRTEHIKKTCSPNWQIFEVSLRLLCGGDKTKTIHIECWDNDDDSMSSHDFIGSCEVVVEDLIKNPNLTKPLVNVKKAKKSKSYKDSGTLICHSQLINLPTFVDFITGGTQLDFSVAIDFTASNGNPLRRDSLHFIAESRPNQYEIAIKAILDICQHYCNSKVFDAYGFGAKMSDAGKMIPIFSLMRPNPTLQDPSVAGVEGVMFAYKNCLHNVRLHGPTNFAPIINQAMRATCEKVKKEGSRYHILLIITDGEICDMEKTKRAIIDATGHPLSIIIVGVGNDEFAKMEELDGDKQRLSVGGRTAERDIVQFVALMDFMFANNEYISDVVMAKLAKAVLAEVPDQLTSYMRKHNIQPRPADNPWPRDREILSNYNAYFTGPAGAPQQPPAYGPNGQAPPPMGISMPMQPPQQTQYSVQSSAPYPRPYPYQPYPSQENGPVAPQSQGNGFPYGAYQAQQAPFNYPTYVQPPHPQPVQVTASAPPVSVDDLQLEFVNIGVKPYPPQNGHP